MACCLLGVKPLSEPNEMHIQLEPDEENYVKY